MKKTNSHSKGIHWRLEDMPPAIRQQVELKLANEKPATRPATASGAPGGMSPPPTPETTRLEARGRRQPTKTEIDARRHIIDHHPGVASVAFEGITFRMANGHRYTPDWVVTMTDGRVVCVEVKGVYRLGSYQRARLAFDQARVEWPTFGWLWAERAGGGAWPRIGQS
jgi:hypothetical protein